MDKTNRGLAEIRKERFEEVMCPDCGNQLSYREARLGKSKGGRWLTPACHVESVDEKGNRTVNGKIVV